MFCDNSSSGLEINIIQAGSLQHHPGSIINNESRGSSLIPDLTGLPLRNQHPGSLPGSIINNESRGSSLIPDLTGLSPFESTNDPFFRRQHSTKRCKCLTNYQQMSHPNSSTSPRQEPPAHFSVSIIIMSCGSTAVINDVHQATLVLTLSFPASIESLMTWNSTQDFLYVWDFLY